MKKIILAIDGMTCSACSNGLEKYLNKQEGIKEASVNLVMANALVEYDENILNQEKIEKFVEEAGFKSLGIFKEEGNKKRKKEEIEFLIFLVLAIFMLYISMGSMINLPSIKGLDMHENAIPYTTVMLIITICFIFYGFDIIKSGFKNLVHKTPNMDTLVTIGVTSSMVYSLYSMYMVIIGMHHYVENLYFESAAIIVFFIKLGRYVDNVNKDKTKEALQKLVKITPKNAVIKINGVEKNVTIDEIKKKDIVVSKPGEKIAVDGKIIEGKAHFDESFLTGESKPVSKAVGQNVIAGSINYDGYIEYEAERIGKDSTISEIVRLVVEATNTKAPIAKLADKVSGYFVPAVIAIAIITFIVYLLLGNAVSEAINVFVTILVVACPCSLGLATPLAIVVSEGLCAENGILVKKSEILENAQKVNTIVFDKTGTLTYGTLKISQIINYSKIEESELMKIVGSIESKATHPISKAFTTYLEEKNIQKLDVKEFEEISGYGVIGKIENNQITLGNSKMLSKFNIENIHEEDEKNLAENGNSIVYVVKDSNIIALIGVNDMIRDDVQKVIKQLNENNIETIMLTGDNKQTAEKIAQKIGIEKVISNVLPSQKVEEIKKLKQEGKYVMMCGDGINDSPALASANIGVSINNAADIAMDSAEVILTRNDLSGIINLIKISKKTIRNIKQNLFWAFFYNTLMIPIAIGLLKPIGISINPMIASLAMVFSSFSVTLNALRLKKKEK
mgnify:FL=1